jgi:hypothetical protein
MFGIGMVLGVVIGAFVERFVVIPLARSLTRHDHP